MRTNWQSYSVQIPDGLDQRTVMQRMLDRGVATRRGIMCSHREVPYQRPGGYDLPVSEWAQDRFIILPLFPQMSDDAIEPSAISSSVRIIAFLRPKRSE